MPETKFAPHIPVYVQVVERFQRAIARGDLRTGDRVSAVRDLAAQLRINPNTVQRAYQELERAGLFETRRGLGTFIAGKGRDAARGQLRRRLAQAATHVYLEELAALGFSAEEAIDLVRSERVKPSREGR